MQPQASLLVSLGIATLAITVVALIAYGIHQSADDPRAPRRFLIGAALWLACSASLAMSGFLSRRDLAPPPMLTILLPTLGLPLALGLSSVGKSLANATPLAWLVGFQAFRLPLELVMHQAAREGVMPEQMTFTGANLDIVTGLSALGLGLWLWQRALPYWVLLIFNGLGTLLLAAIVGIALASLPTFHAFGTEPERLNTWVFYFPFVWLPSALVAAALLGHVVLWRRLLQVPRGVELAPGPMKE